ncbi:MAG TPA: histidine kinase dimerization/phospho-acceptor domain-containing protein, partial [Thermodesulfovibrionales bacterium]|nr:histidine kinase dimerization/phospho-acceptor domain-containing protein [Thermodesulfovibrionales bacterium]
MVYLIVIFIILYVTYVTIFKYRIEDARIRHHQKELTLNQKAILAAKNETEKANRAKTEFISRISHDMKTPLNAITGFAELLEAGSNKPFSENSYHMVREIHS